MKNLQENKKKDEKRWKTQQRRLESKLRINQNCRIFFVILYMLTNKNRKQAFSEKVLNWTQTMKILAQRWLITCFVDYAAPEMSNPKTKASKIQIQTLGGRYNLLNARLRKHF